MRVCASVTFIAPMGASYTAATRHVLHCGRAACNKDIQQNEFYQH